MHRLPHRHVVWDWNGTLLDDLALCVEVLNELLVRRGLDALDAARYHALFDFPIRAFYGKLGFDPKEPFETLNAEFIARYHARRHDCGLHRGADAILGAVVSSGRSQSILSAHEELTLHEVIDHHGIRAHFSHVAGLGDIHAASKIDRGHLLVRDLGHAPHELLLVGDTLHDLEVARALGADCVLVAAGHHSRDRLAEGGVPVYEDLDELAAAFR